MSNNRTQRASKTICYAIWIMIIFISYSVTKSQEPPRKFIHTQNFMLEGDISTYTFFSVAWCPDSTCFIYALNNGNIMLQEIYQSNSVVFLTDIYTTEGTTNLSPVIEWNSDDSKLLILPHEGNGGVFEVWEYTEDSNSRFTLFAREPINDVMDFRWEYTGSDFSISTFSSPNARIWGFQEDGITKFGEVNGNNVSFSFNGDYTAVTPYINGSYVTIYDSNYSEIGTLDVEYEISRLLWSLDSELLIILSLSEMEVWDLANLQKISDYKSSGIILDAKWIDSQHIIINERTSLVASKYQLVNWDIHQNQILPLDESTGRYDIFEYLPSSDSLIFSRDISESCVNLCGDVLYVKSILYPQLAEKCIFEFTNNVYGDWDDYIHKLILGVDSEDTMTYFFDPSQCVITATLELEDDILGMISNRDGGKLLTWTSSEVSLWILADR